MSNAPLILWPFRNLDRQPKTNMQYVGLLQTQIQHPDLGEDEMWGHISNVPELTGCNNNPNKPGFNLNMIITRIVHVNTLNVVVIAWLYGRRQEDIVQSGFWIFWSQSDGGEGSVRHLTSGSWEVTQLLAYDESISSVYFLSTEEGSTQRHLYRYASKI